MPAKNPTSKSTPMGAAFDSHFVVNQFGETVCYVGNSRR